VAVSYDSGGTVRYYINGAASGNTTNLRTFTFSNFIIGRRNSTTFELFNGSIDDVRIYNRVLSATEIASLAAEYRP
jgi:hypothetical protein